MILKLYRDQARAIRNDFFPYLEMLCETKYQDTRSDIELNLTILVIRSIFLDLLKIFDKKLLSDSNNITFKFSDHQGIVLYMLLMELPINSHQVWLVNLRQLVCDTLHNQMLEPIQDPGHRSSPGVAQF